jgi:hypothetical protein
MFAATFIVGRSRCCAECSVSVLEIASMKISAADAATEHESATVSPNVEATVRPISFEPSTSLRRLCR